MIPSVIDQIFGFLIVVLGFLVLAAQDPVKMRHFFRRYRRQMGDRFYRVDVDLKRLCVVHRGVPPAAVCANAKG